MNLMTPERFQQINQLFHEALAQAPADREVFLSQACGGDVALQAEVEDMLAATEGAGNFLDGRPEVPDSMIVEQTPSFIGRQIRHYKILSQLGRGGMGEVYLAEDQTLGRRIALKLLTAEFTQDRDRVRRFEQEAKAASALNHPNIVTIHEIGMAEDGAGRVYYIASEFIEGQMLRHRIRQGRISVSEALDIALQIANALQVAHDHGIVHRDIKPENVMLRPDGFVKVLDFGLAKLTEISPLSFSEEEPITIARTTPGTIIGTPSYMSPEQARAVEVDHRSDLWSLGVVLYEMVAGARPFQGATMTDVIISIIERRPAPLTSLLSPCPPELARIIGRALAKEKDDRYASAREMAAELKELKRRVDLGLENEAEEEPAALSAPTAELPTQQIPQLETRAGRENETQIAPPTARLQPPPATQSPAAPARRFPRSALLALLAVLAVAGGVLAWKALRPGSAPPAAVAPAKNELVYSLLVQRMSDGQPYREPFEATGRELFQHGWKFRFRISAPQEGYLYLLNEGPAPKGAISYQFLSPSPSVNEGSARLPANQPFETGWYLLGESAGTERLFLVWAREPLPELEAVKGVLNPVNRGAIVDAVQLDGVRQFLSRNLEEKPESEAVRGRNQTILRRAGNLFIHPIELEHQ